MEVQIPEEDYLGSLGYPLFGFAGILHPCLHSRQIRAGSIYFWTRRWFIIVLGLSSLLRNDKQVRKKSNINSRLQHIASLCNPPVFRVEPRQFSELKLAHQHIRASLGLHLQICSDCCLYLSVCLHY